MNNNYSHGYGDQQGYNQQQGNYGGYGQPSGHDQYQQQPQYGYDQYQQQQQPQYGYDQYQQQPQPGAGGRPDEFQPPQYQNSQYGASEYPMEKARDFDGAPGDEYDEDGERGIKDVFMKTSVDQYNQEHSELRVGRVAGALLVGGLAAYGIKRYMDNKKKDENMLMQNEIGGMPYGDQKPPYASQHSMGPPPGHQNPYGQ
ncbi:hypothetical protein GGI07_002449 [Coemansia sp. Benny D115]|nr:hypothetical protein GGI07_002449 [Coemansia sp. Benny D115]